MGFREEVLVGLISHLDDQCSKNKNTFVGRIVPVIAPVE